MNFSLRQARAQLGLPEDGRLAEEVVRSARNKLRLGTHPDKPGGSVDAFRKMEDAAKLLLDSLRNETASGESDGSALPETPRKRLQSLFKQLCDLQSSGRCLRLEVAVVPCHPGLHGQVTCTAAVVRISSSSGAGSAGGSQQAVTKVAHFTGHLLNPPALCRHMPEDWAASFHFLVLLQLRADQLGAVLVFAEHGVHLARLCDNARTPVIHVDAIADGTAVLDDACFLPPPKMLPPPVASGTAGSSRKPRKKQRKRKRQRKQLRPKRKSGSVD